MAKIHLLFPLLVIIFFSCQNQSQQTSQQVNLDVFKVGPQLVKIPIENTAMADSLIKRGMDVIVVEENYVIARIDAQQANTVQSMSLQMNTFDERELVQRLIKIIKSEEYDLQNLASTGIDIWEVKGDTVLAQAFDKQIRRIKEMGFDLEIIEKNIQNLVNKPDKN